MQKCKNCLHVCISLCTTVVHNTAQSSTEYLPSYPPDKHQSSDAVYWRKKGETVHDTLVVINCRMQHFTIHIFPQNMQ